MLSFHADTSGLHSSRTSYQEAVALSLTDKREFDSNILLPLGFEVEEKSKTSQKARNPTPLMLKFLQLPIWIHVAILLRHMQLLL